MRISSKKIISLILVFTLLFSMSYSAFAAAAEGFSDVSVTFTSDKKQYKSGEEIKLKTKIENVTGQKQYVSVSYRATPFARFDDVEKYNVSYAGVENEADAEFLATAKATHSVFSTEWMQDIYDAVFGSFWSSVYLIMSMFNSRYEPISIKVDGVPAVILAEVDACLSLPEEPTEPSEKVHTVTFDLNYKDATNNPESQQIVDGQNATEPAVNREGYQLIGWYRSTSGYSDVFDFSSKITEDLTLYAKWYDENDTKDSDGDGLPDSLEVQFGSDPYKNDSDSDGIDDFTELNWLNTDPSSINNGADDADSDGLTNAEECKLGTNPAYYDTDHDYLSDYDEVNVYRTDPLKADTDGDGVEDGTEVTNGSDPLIIETSFSTSASLGTVDENNPVAVEATVKTNAEGAGTLEIKEVTSSDNALISKMIPGYLGSAFDFTTSGKFVEATLTFYYDTALGTIGEKFQPRVYYVNEATGEFEEVPNQIVEDGKITVSVEHFSTYILLNKVAFDIIWNEEIKSPIVDSQGNYSGIDVIFVIDDSGSMSSYNRLTTAKTALNTFLNALGSEDRAALIKFTSSATVLSPLTSDIDSVKAKVSSLKASGTTAMYTGLDEALNLLTDSNKKYGYRMIIALTDGNDEPSTTYNGYYQSRVDRANANDITIYTIGAGTSVSTSILTQVANNTGGAYYTATMTSGITDAFDKIKQDTVDITTDSNNDGISDYYTELLNKGALKLSNGTVDLTGVTDYYGEDNVDWDGDGLLNGEEIVVVESHNKVYAKLLSNPILVDTDGDGFSDFEEVKKYKSNPLKYSKNGGFDVEALVSGFYTYEEATNDWSEALQYFDWKKTDESKETYINYFYNYASESTISENASKIAELEVREKAWEIIGAITQVVSIGKDILDSGTDLASNKKAVEKTVDKYNKDHQTKIKLFNEKKYDKIVEDWCDDYKKGGLKNATDIYSSVSSAIDKFDFSGILAGIDSVEGVVSVISTVTSTITTVNEKFSLNLGKTFNDFSTKYQTWMGQTDGVISNANKIGIIFDAVDLVNDIGDLTVLYGKLQANSEAFIEYIDLIDYIAKKDSHDYIRNAAGDIAKIVLDKSNTEYYKQLAGAAIKQTSATFIKSAITIVGNTCPYVKAAELIYDTAKVLISMTGLPVMAKAMVQAQGIKAISNGCTYFLSKKCTVEGLLYSFEKDDIETVNLYLTQLAQSRVVGEDAIFAYFANEATTIRNKAFNAIVGLINKAFGTSISTYTEKEANDLRQSTMNNIYNRIRSLKLNVSTNLPDSGKSNFSAGGGGAGGGGGAW